MQSSKTQGFREEGGGMREAIILIRYIIYIYIYTDGCAFSIKLFFYQQIQQIQIHPKPTNTHKYEQIQKIPNKSNVCVSIFV